MTYKSNTTHENHASFIGSVLVHKMGEGKGALILILADRRGAYSKGALIREGGVGGR